MTRALEPALRAGLAALDLSLDEGQVERLLAYLDLLRKWNKVYNLTAVRGPQDMLVHHLLDCLAIVPPLRRHLGRGPARILDVGSGGGLPGVVLAICEPAWQVDCVDTVAKKAAFVQQVAVETGLANLRGVHARVERLPGPYDLVCARAFAALPDLVRLSRGALGPDGVWAAMKGKRPDGEIAALDPQAAVFHVEPLAVPGLAAERCLVWMRPAGQPVAGPGST